MLRNLSALDRDIQQGLGRIISEAFRDGINCSIISGGRLAGGVPQSIYAQSITQNFYLGSKMRMVDGREFIYSKAGAGNHGIGTMHQAEVPEANWSDEVQTAYGLAVGVKEGTILITTGTTLTANEWKDGYLNVLSGTGVGQCHKIESNTAHETLPYVTLYDALVSAILAADHVSIIKNRFLDTIIVPTGVQTGRLTGVPLLGLTASYFYWSQVKGPAPVLADTGAALAFDHQVGNGGAVEGACDVLVATTATALPESWGRVLSVGAATEYAIVDLDLGL